MLIRMFFLRACPQTVARRLARAFTGIMLFLGGAACELAQARPGLPTEAKRLNAQ